MVTFPTRRKTTLLATVASSVLLATAACSGPSSTSSTATPAVVSKQGGVLRVGTSTFNLSGNLDPTDEYDETGWSILNPIERTLVTYKYAQGGAGLQLVPDLATSVPAPTDHGLTYTFRLKPGIKFGPPLNREITSKDIAFAFQRINWKSVAAQYGFYYDGVIRGMTGNAPRPTPISGISTPNASTIVFHLTHPVGDFLNRLTMDATAPIPPSVGQCFPSSGTYGYDIIASGPYIIQGAQNLNVSSCKTIKPLPGMKPESQITLVRNPDYNPATDRQSGRKNYPNAIQFTIDTNVTDIFGKIQTGGFDTTLFDQPPKVVLRTYLISPSLRSRLRASAWGYTDYLAINTETPPFDDVHVRQAVNWVLDRAALQGAWGGSIAGRIATEMIPPVILGGAARLQPPVYSTPGMAGSLSKAEAAMRSSRYDPKHDGRCDVAACRNIILLINNTPPWTDAEPILVQDLAKIGIQLVPREMESGAAYTRSATPKNRIPLYVGFWIYDYPDPYTVMYPLLDGGAISANGNANFSLVGLTPSIARSIGITYPPGGSPNIDPQIARCEAIVFGSQRSACWAALDQYMMRNVAPVAPFQWRNNLTIVGSDVTNFLFTLQVGVVYENLAVSNHLSVPS
jgi:peptide/nickel transport system substrate-binding protein